VYPVCLEITGKLCVVVGGGSVAERKVSGLITAGAEIRVVSPQLTSTLAGLAEEGRIEWLNRGYRDSDLDGALLVFAATDNREVQQAVARQAGRSGQLVNVVDEPGRCTFQIPAVVRRGDLLLAVSTAGKSPAVAAMIRHQLEERYGKEYGHLLDLMFRLREQVLVAEEDCGERKILFQNFLHDDILLWIKYGQWDLLRNHLRAVLGSDPDFDVSRPGQDK